MRKIKIYDFYSPLDRSLILVGLKESWLDPTAGAAGFLKPMRCRNMLKMMEGGRQQLVSSAYEIGVCELTQARPQPARRSDHDVIEGRGNI